MITRIEAKYCCNRPQYIFMDNGFVSKIVDFELLNEIDFL